VHHRRRRTINCAVAGTNLDESGAKLIFGGEAMAFGPTVRSNPQPLIISEANQGGDGLREILALVYINTDTATLVNLFIFFN